MTSAIEDATLRIRVVDDRELESPELAVSAAVYQAHASGSWGSSCAAFLSLPASVGVTP